MKNVGIVLAAGRGKRMHTTVQKQYLLLCGKPVLYYSLKVFQDCPFIDELILVTGKDEIDYCQEEIVRKFNLDKVKKIVPGGKERYHSVYEGLKAAGECELVFIHDGARPFVDQGILERTRNAAEAFRACVAGMPVKDTIKVVGADGFAKETPERSSLWQVQTPQTFPYGRIREAYEKVMAQGDSAVTDDAMMLETAFGEQVRVIEGSYQNLKITTPEDISTAELYLNRKSEKKC